MKGRNNTPNTMKEKSNACADKNKLTPMNDRQAEYIDAIYNHPVVIAIGVWGSSKAQPLYSKVLTTAGWKDMGDVVIGDYVITPKNTKAKVLEVHPFKDRKVFEFTLRSGRKVRSCEDHLWNVRATYKDTYSKVFEGIRTVPTSFIVSNIDSVNFSLPLTDSIGSSEDIQLPIPPYQMGIFLAEGHLGNRVSFTTTDAFIVEEMDKYAKSVGCSLKNEGISYYFNMEDKKVGNQFTGIVHPVKQALAGLSLLETRSHTKFIPEVYLKASIGQKKELLRGLMDGDGTAGSTPLFTTTSRVMAEQVRDLAYSLGYYACLRPRKTKYTYKEETLVGMDSYAVSIMSKKPKEIFKLPRQQDLCLEDYQGGRYDLMDKIIDVTYVGEEDVQCILIDDEDHLYLTDDYIVTHNTYIPSVIAADLLLSKQIEKIVLARPAEGKAKSVGYYKGTKDEKLSGWTAPITDTLKKRLGFGHYDAMVENGRIELLSLEQVKGRSWDNTFILVDEAEDLEPAVAKSLVGRQGVNSTTVITGDINQKDLKSYSGLELLLEVSKYGNIDLKVIDFDSWDYCVRSEESKAWGMAFEKYELQKGRVK